jgi:hypothetical protein
MCLNQYAAVTASNGGRSISSESPNCYRASARRTLNNYNLTLTESLQSESIFFGLFKNWTDINFCPLDVINYNLSAGTARKHIHLFFSYCFIFDWFIESLATVIVLLLTYCSLPINGCIYHNNNSFWKPFQYDCHKWSNCFSTRQQQIYLYSGSAACFLWGTNWLFKWYGESFCALKPGLPGWGSLKFETVKILSWILLGSDPRKTALAKHSSNCKLQTHPLVREGTPHQQTHNVWIQF